MNEAYRIFAFGMYMWFPDSKKKDLFPACLQHSYHKSIYIKSEQRVGDRAALCRKQKKEDRK